MAKDNLEFSIDLPDLKKELDALAEDIDDAVQDALNTVSKDGLNAAKNHIRRHGRVWNKDVLNNWVPIRRKTPYGTTLTGFRNYSDHASVVDEGATYTSKKPPYKALERYVKSEYPNVQSASDVYLVTKELQDQIYKNGLTGIHFSDVAVEEMERNFERELDKELKKRM